MENITSAQDYANLKQRAQSARGLVVHFSASWCEPCATVNKLLVEQAAEYKDKVLFAEVDCERCEDVCAAEGVESVPVILFFRTSLDSRAVECVADVVGAKCNQITMNLRSLYGELDGKQRGDFDSLDAYLKYLTQRPGVVLFITGTPSRPRCGFTGRLCQMLADMEVYADGELIGGWDICRELNEEGELKSALKL